MMKGMKSKEPKSYIDETGGVLPTRVGKRYHADPTTGEVEYKKVKTNALSASIQLGLRLSVSSISRAKKRDLLYNDFEEVESTYFPKNGSDITPPHHFDSFKFLSYAPFAFRLFREEFDINTMDFMVSLCDKPLRPLANPGAGGSVFYLTADDQFIIKTVHKDEHKFMMRLLSGYYINLVQNKRTLLPKFFGLFCYQSIGKNIRFVVMNNLLPSRFKYNCRFDLKGSSHNRFASDAECKKSSPTFKDLDFNQQVPHGLELSRTMHENLSNTIKKDSLVLESFKIMDYSLLVGVHRIGMDGVDNECSGTAQSDGMSNVDVADLDGLGETASASPRDGVLSTRSHLQTGDILLLEGRSGLGEFINGQYERTTTDRSGRPCFKLQGGVPNGHGTMSGSQMYMFYSADPPEWRLSPVFDGGRDGTLMTYAIGSYTLPTDVPKGQWHVLAKSGQHVPDCDITVSVVPVEDEDITSVPPTPTIAGGRRGSMSFSSPAAQIGHDSGDDDEDGSGTSAPSSRPPSPGVTAHQANKEGVGSSLWQAHTKKELRKKYKGGIFAKMKDEQGNSVDVVIFCGIIDILQNFRFKKKLEHRWKTMRGWGDTSSVQRPDFYKARFDEYICSSVFRPSSIPDKIHSGKRNAKSPDKLPTSEVKRRIEGAGYANPFFNRVRRSLSGGSRKEMIKETAISRGSSLPTPDSYPIRDESEQGKVTDKSSNIEKNGVSIDVDRSGGPLEALVGVLQQPNNSNVCEAGEAVPNVLEGVTVSESSVDTPVLPNVPGEEKNESAHKKKELVPTSDIVAVSADAAGASRETELLRVESARLRTARDLEEKLKNEALQKSADLEVAMVAERTRMHLRLAELEAQLSVAQALVPHGAASRGNTGLSIVSNSAPQVTTNDRSSDSVNLAAKIGAAKRVRDEERKDKLRSLAAESAAEELSEFEALEATLSTVTLDQV